MASETKPLKKEKKPDNRTHAQKRMEEKKEALREYIKGQRYIEEINRDLEREITADELPVVKFKTETRLKLLSKVIPDLKAIDHSGEVSHKHTLASVLGTI